MLKPLKMKMFLIGFICGVILLSADVLHAQKIAAESAAEFAESHGASKIADMFSGSEDSIVCGRSDEVCNENEMCLRARGRGKPYAKNNRQTGYRGYCVPKEEHPLVWQTASNNDGSVDANHINAAKKYGMPIYKISIPVYIDYDPYVYWQTVDAAPMSVELMTKSWMEEYTNFWGKTKLRNDECFNMNGNSTKKVCVADFGETLGLEYAGDNFDGCEVLPVKIYNMQGCFFCPLAAVIFSSANDITAIAFDNFASSFGKLLVIVFAIWLALMTLNQVASMTKQDAPKFISSIIKQGFKVSIAFVLLTNANNLFSYFVNPLLSGGMALGKGIQTTQIDEPTEYKKSIITSSENFFNLRPKDGGHTLYEKIEVYLASLQWRLSYMQAIGSSLFCVGTHTIGLKGLFKSADKPGINKFKDGIRMMFLGGIMTVFGFLLTIAFGFYFLDAILQLAVIGAMLPLMIAGWPFKVTSQYASTGFKMLLNTFFVMFFIGFVVSVNIELVDQSLALAGSAHNKTDVSNDEPKGLEAIALAISEQNIDEVDKATSLGATGFLILAFAFLFGFKFVAKASDLANTLAAGGFKSGISSSIGTMGASLAKGAASKLTKPVRNVASGAYHKAGGLVGMSSGLIGGTANLLGKGASKIGMKRVGNFLKGSAKLAGKAKQLSQKVHSIYRDKNND